MTKQVISLDLKALAYEFAEQENITIGEVMELMSSPYNQPPINVVMGDVYPQMLNNVGVAYHQSGMVSALQHKFTLSVIRDLQRQCEELDSDTALLKHCIVKLDISHDELYLELIDFRLDEGNYGPISGYS